LQAYINKYKIFSFVSILNYIYYSNTSFFDVTYIYLLWSSSIASPTNNNKKGRNIIMSDLLKESIADAKAVRETALANAKTFLEESFANSMKEMFADKLKEEMAEETESPEGEEGKIEEKLASSTIGKDDSNIATKQHPTKPSPAANKNTTPAGKQEFGVKLEEEAGEEGAEVTSEELDEILAELEGEVSEAASDDAGESDDSMEEEINLDELLAELEGEDPAAAPAPAPAPEAPVAPAAPAAPAAEVPAPAPAQVPSPSEGEYSEEVSAEEMAEALVAINEENEQLKSQLSEHIKTVKYLKSVLSETNLLNAKLLYTNKLFKGKALTEDQKLKIINTFDLTKNIREVKLAYTVLAESLNSGASVVKKKTNTTAQTITEGLASKPVSSTKPDSTIVEPQAEVMASRFQKLAGIKK
jgi:hypothetical protein